MEGEEREERENTTSKDTNSHRKTRTKPSVMGERADYASNCQCNNTLCVIQADTELDMFPFCVGEEITAEKNRTKKKRHVFAFEKLLLSSQVWLRALAVLSLGELTIKQRSALFSRIKSEILPSIIIIYTPMVCGSIVNRSCLQKLNLNRFHPVTVRSRQTNLLF